VAQFKAEHAEWLKTQRSWWDRLHPQRFEQEVAALFKKQGHKVEWTGRSGDGGIDIRLTAEDGKRILVQCKSYDKPISPGAVRALIGTARARWVPSCLRSEVTCAADPAGPRAA
jgi:HJR/Mrr/RecB family endonuclease